MTFLPSCAVLVFGLAACSRALAPTGDPRPDNGAYDLVISNGMVVDGTGSAWFHGDVAVRGDRVARITPGGLLATAQATRRIDARGMVVAPGFIDIQSHSRDSFLSGDGRVVSKVTQGITTEIMGEGWSNAPANERTAAAAGSADPEAARLDASFRGPNGFEAWLRAMERHGVSANVGSFVGHTTVRMYAKGMSQGAASPAELDTMRAVLRDAMRAGAFGLASALIYPPGNFASTDEIVEVSKAMAPYGGIYITHMRSEADQYLEAIDEAIAIGRRAGVPVEIYHLKAAGKRNWGKAAAAIARIDSARAAGQDVSANMYAYVAGGTGLAACFPPWASADGKLLENLKDPSTLAKIRAEVLTDNAAWENLCQLATPAGVMVVGFTLEANKDLEGKRLAEIATARSKEWVDALIELTMEEQGRLGMLIFMMSEENVALQMRQPWMKFGTDAGGMDPDSAKELTHPRAYGNFPRILGKYVREEKVMPLEEAIRKMSSAVATRLSIHDRGVLKPGMYADIVVFDPARISDRATYEKPHQLSTGMIHVLVNGVAVVSDSKHTGAKPGRAVRGAGWGRR
ncbi:MAG: N-acyl-D-amino-acid deacylase family protein [Gemmatimonadaceae bacterium]